MSDESSRHVALAVIESYIATDLEGIVSVPGAPDAQLVIDPHRARLGVRFPASGSAPDLSAFENVQFEEVHAGGQTWNQFTVTLADNADEVYGLLCAVLDRVQLGGEEFGEAVLAALDSLTGILALRRGLSTERRVGLFGELAVFRVLANRLGPEAAANAWRGPQAEEHDFGLSGYDLEVKTTLGERRQHWISTVTQLLRTGERPLYLVSVQLTAAAIGDGASLPQLVDRARIDAGDSRADLDAGLRAVGYRDVDADLYRSRWSLRAMPLFFEVDDDFPALTSDQLALAVPSAQRIVDLRYRVDLTGMAPSVDPVPFGGAEWGDGT